MSLDEYSSEGLAVDSCGSGCRAERKANSQFFGLFRARVASPARGGYNPLLTGDAPTDRKEDLIMVNVNLPRIVAGYAYPICPNCDKQYGPDVADAGPVQCDECGKWFEVTTRTVYQAEQMLDYAGNKPAGKTKSTGKSKRSKPKAKPAR